MRHFDELSMMTIEELNLYFEELKQDIPEVNLLIRLARSLTTSLKARNEYIRELLLEAEEKQNEQHTR